MMQLKYLLEMGILCMAFTICLYELLIIDKHKTGHSVMMENNDEQSAEALSRNARNVNDEEHPCDLRKGTDAKAKRSTISGESPTMSEEGADESKRKNYRIFVFSSVGRSGSSLMGELLSQMPNTFYFFEPFMYLQEKKLKGVEAQSSLSVLRKIFRCHINADDKYWTYYSTNLASVRLNGLSPICSKDKVHTAWSCVQDACVGSSNLVVKDIRMRVAWVKELLSDPEFADLKIIHLARDPRGSFLSMKRRDMHQKDPKKYCPNMLQDLRLRNQTKEQFPHSFTTMEYEEFCLDPQRVARNLWRFISGDDQAEIPPLWSDYLKQHTDPTTSVPHKPFGTKRDSFSQIQKWRTEIPAGIFISIQNACGEVIDFLGHRRFSSIREVRNLSIPLV